MSGNNFTQAPPPFGNSSANTGTTGAGMNTAGFSNTGSNTNPPLQFNSNTAAKPSPFSFNSTTTPAFSFGANAAEKKDESKTFGSTSNLGGSSKPTTGNFGFGNTSTANNSTDSAAKPASGFGFTAPIKTNTTPSLSGLSFGAPKPAENRANTTEKSATGAFTFGAKPADSAAGGFSFGAKPADTTNKPASGAFSFGAKPVDTTDKPASGAFSFAAKLAEKKADTTDKPAAESFSFGAKPADTTNKPATGGFSFGAKPADTTEKPLAGGFSFGAKPAEKKADTTDKPATGGFSFGAKPADTTEKPSAGSFSFGAKPVEKKADTAEKPAAGGFTFGAKPAEKKVDTTEKPATGGFSFGTKPAEKQADPTDKPATECFSFGAKPSECPVELATEEKKATVISSNKGEDKLPTKLEDFKPKPMSIMNKNLEDLISKWTTQLSTSSKTFEVYSEKINKWDQILVGSSDSISKLYSDSFQCEQKQLKIDQNLSYIEKQQDELESLLEGYEKQSENLLASVQQNKNTNNVSSSGNEIILTNDQIREKSYKLAEILELKLDSLNTNFSSLISEVNEVSDNFNKSLLSSTTQQLGGSMGSKKDDEDVLEDVLKLLNNHLESLNWIEKNEVELKTQIENLKKKTSI